MAHGVCGVEYARLELDTDAALGCELLTTPKCGTVAAGQQNDQVHEFALGTYRRAAGGRTRWVYLDDESGDARAYHAWWAWA